MRAVLFTLAILVPVFHLVASALNVRSLSGNLLSVRHAPQIVGGEVARPHEYPYQVLLRLTKGPVAEEFCGGALLSRQWVITAAHCLLDVKHIVAILGAHNVTANEAAIQEVEGVKYISHPEWNSDTFQNDIALINLADDLVLIEDLVMPVRLPDSSEKDLSYLHKSAVITGWGKTSDRAKDTSPVLQTVTSNIVMNVCCKLSYLFLIDVSERQICVSGSDRKGPCTADSGAPMVFENPNGERILIGIASYFVSYGCEETWPSVFTRVTHFLDWIYATTLIPPSEASRNR